MDRCDYCGRLAEGWRLDDRGKRRLVCVQHSLAARLVGLARTTAVILDDIKAILAQRRADFEGWGLDPDLAGGYAIITAINSPAAPFEIGEILVLGGEFEREPEGEGRKPSKWDLEYDWFGTDYDAAIERSTALCRKR